MPDLHSGIVIRVGSGPFDATENAATSDPTPYFEWDLPPDITQRRFSLLIENVASDGTVYATSGERVTRDQHFYWPLGVGMNNNFAGLCRVVIQIDNSALEGSAFNWISEPRYFVYDPVLERLYSIGQLRVSWTAQNDPDHLPPGGYRQFHLQVALDPLFADIVYDYDQIINSNTQVIFDVPAESFHPELGTTYFYRVRQHDGMDWGGWSRVHAFRHLSNLSPSVTIDSVLPTNNAEKDVLITFTVHDPEGDLTGVELSYTGGSADNEDQPLSLVEPLINVPVGQHTVTWRSSRQEYNTLAEGIAIQAVVRDGTNNVADASWPPFDLDNRLEHDAGNLGTQSWRWPVVGRLMTIQEHDADLVVEPVSGGISPDRLPLREPVPINAGRLVEFKIYVHRPLENYPDGQITSTFPPVTWNFPIEILPVGEGSPGRNWRLSNRYSSGSQVTYSPNQGIDRTNPHADDERFLFSDPSGWEDYSDGFARPIGWSNDPDYRTRSSSLLYRTPYLRGYLDRFGQVHEYPNGYDFYKRPEWHRGREVWGYDDAWVQVGTLKFADYQGCTTCQGRGWVVSPSGPPYTHQPCPNPDCWDGLDRSKPFTRSRTSGGVTTTWRVTGWYVDVTWYRLSYFLGRPYTEPFLVGPGVRLPNSLKYRQYIAGRSLSDLDGYYTKNANGQDVLQYYEYPTETGQVVRYNKNITATHRIRNDTSVDTTSAPLREYGAGPRIRGYLLPGPEGPFDHEGPPLPLQGRITQATDHEEDPLPVSGYLSPIRSIFFMGADPAIPGHHLRAVPTQVGVPAVRGGIGREWRTQEFKFLFLQPYWDAYNTIHWQVSGSPVSHIRLQAARVLEDGTTGEFQDIIADNASYYEAVGAWLVEPAMFHAYWNTANRQLYESGGTYRLRMQQYNLTTNPPTVGDWVISNPFIIQDGVTNPVSVLSLYYEPWTKIVTIQFRIDDSERDAYTLTKFWYSTDNGTTWQQINLGDIVGERNYLSSEPTDGQNVHTVYWMTAGYSLSPGNEYRVKVEAIPSGFSESMTLPFFRWLTPVNPYLDEAEAQLAGILGRVVDRYFDPATNAWIDVDPPAYEPGRLHMLELEYERIRDQGFWDYHQPKADGEPEGAVTRTVIIDSTGELPDGWVAHPNYPEPYTAGDTVVTLWEVSDAEGLAAWYHEEYRTGETRSQALQRIQYELDILAHIEIPRLQQVILEQENEIRKGLIRQGFYAEQYFQDLGNGDYEEEVEVKTLVDWTTDNEVSQYTVTIQRPWRFRVQSYPERAEQVIGSDGKVHHEEQTSLETVRYKVQMDFGDGFDSQPGLKPLREFVSNYNGQPLTVAQFEVPPEADSLPDPRNDTGRPWENGSVTGDEQFASDAVTSAPPIVVGASLKVSPNQLPGHREDDQLPEGREEYDGEYTWRVAAYNPFLHDVSARPRPQVLSVQANGDINFWWFTVDYLAKAHPQIQTMSLEHEDMGGGFFSAYGFQLSHETKTPAWEDVEPIDFVSDRRARLADRDDQSYSSGRPWVPAGVNRPRPCVVFDDNQMQYMLFMSKIAFNGKWRIMSARAMTLPIACEYEVLFENEPYDAVYGPCVIRWNEQYALFVTTQNTGDVPRLAVSFSDDGESWGSLQYVLDDQAAQLAGAYPSVIDDGERMLMVVEAADGLAFYESTDGTQWAYLHTTVIGDGAERPGLIKLNDKYVLYYADSTNGEIRSTWSSDLSTWQDDQTEMGSDTSGTPTNPFPYTDWYLGNQELFLMYTVKNGGGEHIVHRARLEDRVWTDGEPFWMEAFGQPGHVVDVPSTPEGVARQMNVYSDWFGVEIDPDTVKVRLIFTTWTPEQIEYHRQSAWVGRFNIQETGSYLDPILWNYTSQLDDYPYLQMT